MGKPSQDHYSKESIATALEDKESEVYQQFISDLPKLNYIIMYIKDKKLIDFHSMGYTDVGDNSKTASEAIAEILLKEKASRYVAFKYTFMSADGRPQNKAVGFHWNPPDAELKLKMVYGSSEASFTKAFDKLHKFASGTDDVGDLKDFLDTMGKK